MKFVEVNLVITIVILSLFLNTKYHLMYANTFCVHKFGNMYYIQLVFGSQFGNYKSYKNIEK